LGATELGWRAVVVTLVSLASATLAAAAEPPDDVVVALELDPSNDDAFALTPDAGAQAPIATVLSWNIDEVCVVVPDEGRWSVEGPDGADVRLHTERVDGDHHAARDVAPCPQLRK
jgi:hypothetical protein